MKVKNVITGLLLLIIGLQYSNAQENEETINNGIEKGAFTLGGSSYLGAYHSFSDSGSNNSNFNFRVSAGKMLSNKIELGIGLSFLYYNTNSFNQLSTSLFPSVAYYFNNNKTIVPFVSLHGGVSFVHSSGTQKDDGNVYAGSKGGISIFLNKSVALNIAWRYCQ